MYEMLTGQSPAESTERLTIDVLKPPRQWVPSISPLMEKIILTGMKMQVEERFQTADELLDALNGKLISPRLRKAREFVTQGDLNQAVQAYEICLNTEPDNGEAATELAVLQLYLSPDRAIDAAQKAMQLKPNDGRSHGVLGLMECRRANWAGAVTHLEKAAALSPQEGWIHSNLAWALGKMNRWKEAEKTIAQALLLNEHSTFALGIQAWVSTHQQNYKSAIRSARQAIFKSKQENTSQNLLKWVYPCLTIALDKATVTSQSKDVERCLQEYIAQITEHSFALGFQGYKHAVQGSWSNATTAFEQATQKRQVPTWIWLDLGISQENLGNISAAIQAYERSLQQTPDQAIALFRLGTLLGKQGQFAQAKAFLDKATKLSPTHPESFHNLGWVLLNLKQQNMGNVHSREILSAYRKALELYSSQGKTSIAQSIQTSFQSAGVEI
jgi:eukaryotic-like serine/threonine-protein kinase